MVLRHLLPRVPILRAFLPRVSAPILPLASRFTLSSSSSHASGQRPNTSRLFHHFPARLTSTPSSPPPHDPSQSLLPPNATLSQRLKHLIKTYGWYALGVYVILSALDFGVAFAAVNLLGADHVSQWTASVKAYVEEIIHNKPPEPGRIEVEAVATAGGSEGLYAMLLLAWTVHKTLFLPVRVGLTAGLTPKLVGWLAKRGWAGGEGTRRAALEVRERIRERRNRD
jgi:N-terminal acetyltransferase 2